MAQIAGSEGSNDADHAGPEGWVDVARVQQLADAGFLASRLGAEGIDCEVHRQDGFDAVHGAYVSTFTLRVGPEQASASREVLRQESLAYEIEERERSGDPGRWDTLGWRSLALATLTGAACFWVGQRLSEAQLAQRRNSLAEFVAAVDRPFIAKGPGEQVNVLSADPINRCWRIETDLDGDGAADLRCSIPYLP